LGSPDRFRAPFRANDVATRHSEQSQRASNAVTIAGVATGSERCERRFVRTSEACPRIEGYYPPSFARGGTGRAPGPRIRGRCETRALPASGGSVPPLAGRVGEPRPLGGLQWGVSRGPRAPARESGRSYLAPVDRLGRVANPPRKEDRLAEPNNVVTNAADEGLHHRTGRGTEQMPPRSEPLLEKGVVPLGETAGEKSLKDGAPRPAQQPYPKCCKAS
jgi:hypothetical protein